MDTSILTRLANTLDHSHDIAARAIVELSRQGDRLCVCPQNFVEFWNVATRPAAVNGLGLTPVDAEVKCANFEATFPLLPDTPDIYPMWRTLVASLGIVGKQVHDARLVAVCHVHGMTRLLTFNVPHFSRMAGFGSGLRIVDPRTV